MSEMKEPTKSNRKNRQKERNSVILLVHDFSLFGVNGFQFNLF